ncbi:MAG: tRNA (N(6)-L-threonylcarbamoyladenosine(37)-C(2))-methylthiotransferase MtaB [Coriobacteriales bacterium]|jgi:threonylcarbamoyladenosine tRNA methylthiotransferase MtaB|nr:tRNA (N(6)-L-threonylcarbamoyladenosine(37)-C(2))-methylthiotransferase MtaB [Coriobacteriales bacterium]
MKATFYVHNIGCKVNRVESDTIRAQLLKSGAQGVEREDAAVIVINTCTVTSEADTKTRKAIRQAHAFEQQPWVVVTGCSTVLHAEELAKLGERVVVEPDRAVALKRALKLLDELPKRGKRTSSNSAKKKTAQAKTTSKGAGSVIAMDFGDDDALRVGEGFNTRVGIKIQDGCDNRCTYCIVSTVRGVAVSTPVQKVLTEVKRAARAGARELVFTGVNMGSYSDEDYDLTSLLQASLEAAPKVRIRLSSLEPLDVTHDLLRCMVHSEGRLCAHLHLPLQSGSDRILRIMERPYISSQFEIIAHRAKSLLPQLALTTDVIVGFPGETDDDFRKTMALCKWAEFSKIHIFRYSRRPGTPAAEMEEQVPAPVKAERAKKLSDLADKLAAADAERRIGTTELVLVESSERGTSESYHVVELKGDYEPGSLVPITFSASKAATLVE